MHYTIYRITNKVNGKIYVGKHKCENFDDSYMGSGKLIKSAIRKYGDENFSKEILFIFDNEDEMNRKEAELVDEAFCLREDTYNICPGGQGGWGYFNSSDKFAESRKKTKSKGGFSSFLKYGDDHRKSVITNRLSKGFSPWGLIPGKNWIDRNHSEETKSKISFSLKGRGCGEENSQFGSYWINDGLNVKKIKGEIPEGWKRGRKI